LKSQINPVIGGVVIVVLLCVVGFFLWKGTGGGAASKPPDAPGNPGPFAPGGAANNKGAKPAAANTRTGPPGIAQPPKP